MERFKVTVEDTDTGEQISYTTDEAGFVASCAIAAIAELAERKQEEAPA